MQMHQVRYFLALRDESSFTRAASRCGVSQPSLTNAIAALERELGGRLFHRKPRIALTPLGRTLLPYLESIAANANHACEIARSLTRAPTAGPAAVVRRATADSEYPSP
jgi:DNA-binding transcriptional LysR family regulator